MANDDVKLSLSLDEKELLKQLDDLKKRSEKALEFKVDNKELRKNQRDLTRTINDTDKLRDSMLKLRDTRVKTDAWTKLNTEVEEYNKKIEGTQERIKNLLEKGYTPDSGWVKNAQRALEKQMAARGPLLGQMRSLESRGVDTKLYSETDEYKKQLALLNEKQKLIRGNLIPIEREIAIQKGVTEQEQAQSGATSQETATLKALEEELARVEEKWRNVHAQQEKIRNTRLGAVADYNIPRGQDLEYDKLRDKALELSTVMGDLQYKIWHFNDAENQAARETEKFQDQVVNAKEALADAFKGIEFDPDAFTEFYGEVIDKVMEFYSVTSKKDITGEDILGLRNYTKYIDEVRPKLDAFGDVIQQFFTTVEENKDKMDAPFFEAMAEHANSAMAGIQRLNIYLEKMGTLASDENLSARGVKLALKELGAQAAQTSIEMGKLKLTKIVLPVDDFEGKMANLKSRLEEIQARKAELKGEPIDIEIKASNIQKVEDTLLGMLAKLRALKQEKKSLESVSDPTLEQAQRYEAVIAEIEQLTAAIAKYKGETQKASSDEEKATKSTSKLADAFRRLRPSALGVKDVMKGYSKHIKSAESAHNKFMRSLRHGMSNLTKYVFGFRSLFFLIRRLRSGIKEGIKNLVQYDSANNETNKKMTELMTSLLFVKNAWGAAFAPVLNVVLPILSALLDMIARVGNALAMFFGRLMGATSVIQAVRVQTQDYADSLRNVGGGASGASKAADKLHDRLAAFDDLNVLGKDDQNDPSKSGGGGGAGNLDVPAIEDMFTRELAQSSLADMIQAAWLGDGDMSEVGAMLGDFIEGALERIPWDEIQSTAGHLGFSVGTFLTGLFDDPATFEAIGHTIAEGLNTVTLAIHGFFEGYDAGSFASSAAGAIASFFRDTDWSTIGQNFSDFASTIMTEISTFFNDLDIDEIAEAWESFWTSIDWEEVAVGFNELSISIADLTVRVVQAQAAGVTDWLWDLFHANEGNHLGIMGMGILRLGEYCSYAIEWVVNLWQSVRGLEAYLAIFLGQGLIGLLEGVWQFISGFFSFIFNLITSFVSWLVGNVVNAIENFVNTAKDLVKYLKDQVVAYLNLLKYNWNLFKSTVASGIRYISDQVTHYLDLAGDAFWNWYDVISSVWNAISSVFTSGANGALATLETWVNAVINGINTVIDAFNGLDIDIPAAVQTTITALTGATVPSNISFNIPRLSTVSLPRLAQGAVIPANHEFAAILGDQTHGTNIEAPLDTIKQAVAEVIANNNNDEVIRLLQQLIGVVESKNLSIGDRQIGEANARYQNRQNVIRGVRGVV